MRKYATDPKILAILNIIEQKLDYEIRSDPLSLVQKRMVNFGVQFKNGKWIFLVPEDRHISQSTLCHELMHICMAIEGFPGTRLSLDIKPASPEHAIYFILFNTILHIFVFERVSLLGFDNDIAEHTQEVKDVFLPQLRQCLLFQGVREPLRTNLTAVTLAQILTQPLPSMIHQDVIQTAQQEAPNALKRTLQIQEVMCKDRRPYAKWYIEALEKTLSIVAMPIDTLRHEPLHIADSRFFCQMLKRIPGHENILHREQAEACSYQTSKKFNFLQNIINKFLCK
jgi:hypothetical protein